MEALDQGHAEPDHDAAHDQRADYSPDEDAMLGAGRHPEIVKDQDENEDVIDPERVFDDVAGEKIEAVLGSLGLPNEQIERERESDPDQAASGWGAHAP